MQVKQKCHTCGQMVYWIFGVGRNGSLGFCEYCATDKQVEHSKSLKQLNEERARGLGKLGGQATKKKYGKEHYQKLAKNMNEKRWGKKLESQKSEGEK